jgi:hypothetical protein
MLDIVDLCRRIVDGLKQDAARGEAAFFSSSLMRSQRQ